MPEEEWRPVVGYERLYDVSSLGRVYRKPRTPKCRHGRFLKPRGRKTRKAYLGVSLSRNGVVRTRDVHLLVLEAFVGPRPMDHEGDHKNRDTHDNRAENLQWVPATMNRLRGEENGTAKLSRADVENIRLRYAAGGVTTAELANDFNVSRRAITGALGASFKSYPMSADLAARIEARKREARAANGLKGTRTRWQKSG